MPIISVPITDSAQWQQLRKPNVGCSEVAALFGIHEFISGYALAARKLGKLPDARETGPMRRGRRLEPVARQMMQEQRQDLTVIAADSYHYDPDLRFGATPDLFVRDEHGRLGIVQIKTMSSDVFARKWHNRETGAVEPPLWIALQAMCEQHLTGAAFAMVAAMIIDPWDDFILETVDVPYLPFLIEQTEKKVAAFWEMVDRGELPDPDYGADHKNLAAVLRQDDGTEIDLRQDNEISGIVAQLTAARHAKKLAEDQIDHCQAAILHKIGAAVRAIFSGGVITAKTVNRKEYVAKASVYRPIRIKSDREMEEAA